MLKYRIEKEARKDIVNLIDAGTFCQIHNQVFDKTESDYENNQVSNEIDVIAIRGMQAYFILCKAASEIKKSILVRLQIIPKMQEQFLYWQWAELLSKIAIQY